MSAILTSSKKFQPTCDTADLQDCTREQIVNTYDNTILYTDYVVANVIEKLKAYPQYQSAMLYISDHGESLGENNIYLHGLPQAGWLNMMCFTIKHPH